MAAGFCFAQLFTLDDATRRRITIRLGLALTAAFLVVRAINIYGDPSHWTHRVRCLHGAVIPQLHQVPSVPGLHLDDLGPALLLLAWYDRRRFSNNNPLIVFGRVPLFYFVLHFYAIHILLGVMSYFRYGSRALGFIFNAMPTMGGPMMSTLQISATPSGSPTLSGSAWLQRSPSLPLVPQYKATHRWWWLSYL